MSLNSIALHFLHLLTSQLPLMHDDFLLFKHSLVLSYNSLLWSFPISLAITLQHNWKAAFLLASLKMFSSISSSTSLYSALSYVISLHPRALNMLDFTHNEVILGHVFYCYSNHSGVTVASNNKRGMNQISIVLIGKPIRALRYAWT